MAHIIKQRLRPEMRLGKNLRNQRQFSSGAILRQA